MTREEYNQRTGNNVTPDEFELIERAYMAASDSIDKDQFCADVPKLTATVCAYTEHIELLQRELKNYKDMFSDVAKFIAEKAEAHYCKDLRERAIRMMGAREYIAWKMDNKHDLWDEDLALVRDYLDVD